MWVYRHTVRCTAALEGAGPRIVALVLGAFSFLQAKAMDFIPPVQKENPPPPCHFWRPQETGCHLLPDIIYTPPPPLLLWQLALPVMAARREERGSCFVKRWVCLLCSPAGPPVSNEPLCPMITMGSNCMNLEPNLIGPVLRE